MAEKRELRDQRLDLRVTARQRDLLEQAAASSGSSMSAFIVDAAATEAQRILSERTVFELDEEGWRRFSEALERPAMDKGRLKALLESPDVFSGS